MVAGFERRRGWVWMAGSANGLGGGESEGEKNAGIAGARGDGANVRGGLGSLGDFFEGIGNNAE